jgi:hypothetical protein
MKGPCFLPATIEHLDLAYGQAPWCRSFQACLSLGHSKTPLIPFSYSSFGQASDSTLSKVRKIIAEQLAKDNDAIKPDAKFVDLGADSLDTVSMPASTVSDLKCKADTSRCCLWDKNSGGVNEMAPGFDRFLLLGIGRLVSKLSPRHLCSKLLANHVSFEHDDAH